MIILSQGGVMAKAYKFLRCGVFNEEEHLFNFMHEDRICEDSGIENVCIEDG